MDSDYKKRMAERYKKVPEAEKPHVKICPVCKMPEHEREVCVVTGLYHAKEGRMVCGVRVDTDDRIITGTQFTKMLSTLRVAWQKARTEKVLIDEDSIAMFQSFVMSRRWQLQRYGVMYGIVTPGNVVEVHAVYEPEQEGGKDDTNELPDPRMEKVDRLAKMLGLTRVGVIVSHGERDKTEIVLTGKELMMCVKDQSRYGDVSVIVTVAPNVETRQTEVEVWQGSEQSVQLYRCGYLSASKVNKGYINSKISLEVSEVKTDAKGSQSLVCKEPSLEIDTRWMLAPVAVEAFPSLVIGSRFIRITRPGEAPPTVQNLKMFMNDPKRAKQSFLQKISDFHVLVFLMEHVLDVKNDMPILVGCVQAKDTEGAKAYQMLIESYYSH